MQNSKALSKLLGEISRQTSTATTERLHLATRVLRKEIIPLEDQEDLRFRIPGAVQSVLAPTGHMAFVVGNKNGMSELWLGCLSQNTTHWPAKCVLQVPVHGVNAGNKKIYLLSICHVHFPEGSTNVACLYTNDGITWRGRWGDWDFEIQSGENLGWDSGTTFWEWEGTKYCLTQTTEGIIVFSSRDGRYTNVSRVYHSSPYSLYRVLGIFEGRECLLTQCNEYSGIVYYAGWQSPTPVWITAVGIGPNGLLHILAYDDEKKASYLFVPQEDRKEYVCQGRCLGTIENGRVFLLFNAIREWQGEEWKSERLPLGLQEDRVYRQEYKIYPLKSGGVVFHACVLTSDPETPLYLNARGRCVSTWANPFNDDVKTSQRIQVRVLRSEMLLIRLEDILIFVKPEDLHRVSQKAEIFPHHSVPMEHLIEMEDGSVMALKHMDHESSSLLRWQVSCSSD